MSGGSKTQERKMFKKEISGHQVAIQDTNQKGYRYRLFVDDVKINDYDSMQSALQSAQSFCDSEPVTTPDNSIINSLKRLKRAGSENSRTTQKLREAAKDAALTIIELIPRDAVDEPLPRGYQIAYRRSNIAGEFYLQVPNSGYDSDARFLDIKTSHYLHNDFHCHVEAATREDVLKFASDIASGLLSEIAAWLEERAQANKEATAKLETAE
jgi:hypothetical protein